MKMRKITFFLVICLFLLSFTSAEVFTFDNKVDYTDDTLLKVDIINRLDLIGDNLLGTMELKSHESVEEIKLIDPRKDIYQAVMYYDFTNWELYSNGLGNVYFKDMKTEEDIDKLYYFAIWKELTKEECKGTTSSIDINAKVIITCEDITYMGWEKYNSKDIPNTKLETTRIALMTIVNPYDYIDAVWTIAGQKIEEHAEWEASNTRFTGLTDEVLQGSLSTLFVGINITVGSTNVNLTNVAKIPGGTETTAYIYFANGTEWTSSTYAGDNASFINVVLEANTPYMILSASGGATYSAYRAASSFPIDMTEVSMTGGGRSDKVAETARAWSIESLDLALEITDFPPNVVLNSPVDNFNSAFSSVTFNTTVTDNLKVQNVSLIIDGVLDQTNTSQFNGTYIFTKSLSNGLHNWSILAYDNASLANQSINRTVNITVISPTINLYFPKDGLKTTETFINFTGDVTDDFIIVNVSLFIDGVLNETNSSGIKDVNYTFEKIFVQGDYTWFYRAFDNDSNMADSVIRNFSTHGTNPTIDILTPSGQEDFVALGNNFTLIWNITEVGQNVSQHITNCSYTYNGSATYLNLNTCLSLNTTEVLYLNGINNISMNVTDDFNLTTTTFSEFSYKLIELNQTFSTSTIEGNLEDFSAYVDLASGLSINSLNLVYDGIENVGGFSLSGDFIIFSITNVLIPNVDDVTNKSFYWNVVLSDNTKINLTEQNQTVTNISIDDCTTFSNEIMRFTIVDEELQTSLQNISLETAINIYSADRTVNILNISANYSSNPTTFCLSTSLTASANYSLDTVAKYEGFNINGTAINAIEYYNIVDFELTNSTLPGPIILYDLNLTDSTEFQLTFTGSDFLPVENALVFVERQYISENTFKTVELPKTDSNGQTVLHLVRNNIVYNIIVTKDGVILGSFSNLIAFCDDFSIGDCKITLNAISTESDLFNYDEEVGILFSEEPQYNETTQIVFFSFTSADGTPKNVTMIVERRDVFANTTICSNTLVSTSGTVVCSVGNVSDSELLTSILIDDEEWLISSVKIDTEGYGPLGAVALFILSLALIFMFGDSKNGVIVSLVIGYGFAVAFGWIVGGLTGIGSAGIWIIVLTVTAIYQINKNRNT